PRPWLVLRSGLRPSLQTSQRGNPIQFSHNNWHKKREGVKDLSGKERFRLVTTLTGEGNREEAIMVAEACPRLRYLMADKDYGERCIGAWRMVREADAMIER
ncbi:MAG: hypothetical protein QGH74_01170, partial [Candidatus Brocadiia bacterium]|nr:hypothetical protein [Candidatus Brocadiia bacterium]